jgi:hypothetical protein
MTCSLVRMSPFLSMTNPDPSDSTFSLWAGANSVAGTFSVDVDVITTTPGVSPAYSCAGVSAPPTAAVAGCAGSGGGVFPPLPPSAIAAITPPVTAAVTKATRTVDRVRFISSPWDVSGAVRWRLGGLGDGGTVAVAGLIRHAREPESTLR